MWFPGCPGILLERPRPGGSRRMAAATGDIALPAASAGEELDEAADGYDSGEVQGDQGRERD
jgi:hypothetical protein